MAAVLHGPNWPRASLQSKTCLLGSCVAYKQQTKRRVYDRDMAHILQHVP